MCVFSFIHEYVIWCLFQYSNEQNEDFITLNFLKFKKILSEIV